MGHGVGKYLHQGGAGHCEQRFAHGLFAWADEAADHGVSRCCGIPASGNYAGDLVRAVEAPADAKTEQPPICIKEPLVANALPERVGVEPGGAERFPDAEGIGLIVAQLVLERIVADVPFDGFDEGAC